MALCSTDSRLKRNRPVRARLLTFHTVNAYRQTNSASKARLAHGAAISGFGCRPSAKASTCQRAVISGAFQALKRTARNARELSRATGTRFYVLEDGKVVDLNRKQKKKRQRASAPR